jgi:hypothetical protein
LLEEKKMPRRKCLKRKGINKRPEAKAKIEKAKRKLESKLPPFSTFKKKFYGFSFFFFC